MSFKFISFEPTPNDAKQLGVITLLHSYVDKDGNQFRYYLTYKAITGKNGGTFFLPPSCKGAGDVYKLAFLPDSNFEKNQIEELCRSGFNDYFKKPIASASPQSALST